MKINPYLKIVVIGLNISALAGYAVRFSEHLRGKYFVMMEPNKYIAFIELVLCIGCILVNLLMVKE